jgi:hypothetical protein
MTTAYWMLPDLQKEEEFQQKPFPVLDVDTGRTRTATIKLVAETMVLCAGRSRPCKQYRIEGVSPADLWFDGQNRLVRQKSVEQGHAMELRLKSIHPANDEN